MARFLKDRTKSKGAAPGSLIFIGKQKMTKNSIQVIQYTSEGLKEFFPETMENIVDIVSNDHMTWINISGRGSAKTPTIYISLPSPSISARTTGSYTWNKSLLLSDLTT